jgi:pimeloyl-ACP methyl ester carboxylesterase
VARILVIVVAALLAVVPGAAAATAPQDLTLTMDDGVKIACGMTRAGVGGPAVMLFHGIGGRHQDLDPIAAAFNAAGYTTLACDARGQGASGGFFDLDGPRTVTDVREQFDWLASQPGIDGKHVGAWGISLGGGAVLNSTVAGVPWAAVETVETWSDLYTALVPNGLPKSGLIYSFAGGIPAAGRTPELSALIQSALSGENLGTVRDYAAPRSSLPRLGSVTTPAYLFQGRRDFAFDIDQARRAYAALRGPKKLYVGDFGHSPSSFPAADIAYVLSQGVEWFDRYLKGTGTTDGNRTVQVASDPWTNAKALPSTRTLTLRLRGSAAIGSQGKVVRTIRLPSRTLETFGAPVIRARISGSFTHLVAVLENGTTLVSDGGAALAPRAKQHWVTFRLIADAVRLRARTLKLTLAGASTAQDTANLLYPVGVPSGQRLRVGAVTVSLPVLRTPVSR